MDGRRGSSGWQRAEAQLRTRGQSRVSPPATRGWLGRCGPHPQQMRPWDQRRSACRRQTGSRREPTGPRWKAGGSGGGTRGRCSHGRPGGRGGHCQRGHQPLPRGQQPHREKGLLDSTRVKPMASPRQSGEAGLLLRSAYPHPILPTSPTPPAPHLLHPRLPPQWSCLPGPFTAEELALTNFSLKSHD